MKSTLRIKSDPEIELEVGASDLANLIGSMPDTADEKVLKVLEVLASHPASAVRIAIACKDNLTAETVATLSVDKEINVLRQLVNTNKGRELLETSQLMKMIGFDNELAQSIASYVERYENADVGAGQIDAAHIGTLKIGLAAGGVAENGILQVGIGQHRTVEVGAA